MGSAHDVISTYQRMVSGPDALPVTEADDKVSADSPVRIVRLSLHDAAGAPVLTATAGEPLVARVALLLDSGRPATVRLSFYDFDRGTLLTELAGHVDAEHAAAEGQVALEFVMPELLLAPGTYTLGVTATPAGAPRPTAWRFGRTTLYVTRPRRERRCSRSRSSAAYQPPNAPARKHFTREHGAAHFRRHPLVQPRAFSRRGDRERAGAEVSAD